MAKMSPSTLRIGYRYRPARLAPDYDAIVIGSGMGGLTTAALLSEGRVKEREATYRERRKARIARRSAEGRT